MNDANCPSSEPSTGGKENLNTTNNNNSENQVARREQHRRPDSPRCRPPQERRQNNNGRGYNNDRHNDDRRYHDNNDRRHDRRFSDRDERGHDDRRHRDDRRRDEGHRRHDHARYDDRHRDDRHDHARYDDRHRDDRRHNDNSRRRRSRSRSREQKSFPKHGHVDHQYHVVKDQYDTNLCADAKDPRNPEKRMTKQTKGRNTESFDPASTLVRPDLRIQVKLSPLTTPLKHDDVVIVPELFGKEDDWSLYYKLVEEMTEIQKKAHENKGAEWIPWHEGAHLISKNPQGSPTFQTVIDRLCDFFSIRKQSIGTRFNWYKDSADWKPFHHDSAAFNPQRAKNQNITVGVSFGATRELAFIRAASLEDGDKVRLYFPQTNNGVFSFGRDANILWKHGINALPPEEQNGKGRISIILWGLTENVVEEKGSPPLLGADGQGPHAQRKNRHRNHRGGRR